MTDIRKPVSISAIDEFCECVKLALPAGDNERWGIRWPATSDDVARTIRAFLHYVDGKQDALIGVHFSTNPAFGGVSDPSQVAVRIGSRSVGTSSVFGPEPFGLEPASMVVSATPEGAAYGLCTLLPIAQATYAKQEAMAAALAQRRSEYKQTCQMLESLGMTHRTDDGPSVYRADALPGFKVLVRQPDSTIWEKSGRLATGLPPISMYATVDSVDHELIIGLLHLLATHADKHRSPPS